MNVHGRIHLLSHGDRSKLTGLRSCAADVSRRLGSKTPSKISYDMLHPGLRLQNKVVRYRIEPCRYGMLSTEHVRACLMLMSFQHGRRRSAVQLVRQRVSDEGCEQKMERESVEGGARSSGVASERTEPCLLSRCRNVAGDVAGHVFGSWKVRLSHRNASIQQLMY